jgi:hypothetical protein
MGTKYGPNHYGTLITFKRGVSEAKIKAALAKLAPLCDSPPRIEKFDDRWGGPVFYIP